MKIYFACSITGGREFESIYGALTEALLADGHQVPTAHLAHPSVVDMETRVPAREVYQRDVQWISEADTLVAEVSVPSHGVGYEIGLALGAGKAVLCLAHEDRKVSKMITGNPDSRLTMKTYRTASEAVQLLREYLRVLP